VASRLPSSFPFQSHQAVAEAFAGDVERAMIGGTVLRYSQRAHLLRHAQKLGIGRFEANLIVATVQHRRGGDVSGWDSGQEGNGWWLPVVLFLAIQITITAGVWWVVAG
jgi:hypothetical protein